VTKLKGQKILGRLSLVQVFKWARLSIAALIWQAFFDYFFGRLQKSNCPDQGAGSATRPVLRSRTFSVGA